MSEADFNNNTRNIIAGRAGYRCSYPGCNRVTIGPCKAPDQFDETGMACHIYSSSPGGPRGTGGLSRTQRNKPWNGIWCCYTHGKLIDNKKGREFPASKLQNWKAAHEARIYNEHRGFSIPFGWLSKIEIKSSPLYIPNTSVEFGKVNLLVGPNGTGKTALCEMMAAAGGDLEKIMRWKNSYASRSQWDYQLHYSSPEPQVFRGQIIDKTFFCEIDKFPAADLNHELRFVYLHDQNVATHPIDSVEYIANYYRTSRERILQAIQSIKRLNLDLPFINSISVSDDPLENYGDNDKELSDLNHRLKLLCLKCPQQISASIGDHTQEFTFEFLSRREQSIVVISIGIALACLISCHAPVVLIIDLGQQLLTDELLNKYVLLLSSDQFQFQTILVSPIELTEVDWTGWSIINFANVAPKVILSQSHPGITKKSSRKK